MAVTGQISRPPVGRSSWPLTNRERDARTFKSQVESDLDRGDYRDPEAGKQTFAAYAETWLATKATTCRVGTAVMYDSHLRNHVLPMFGSRPLARINRSEVQAWANERAPHLAPSTLTTVFRVLSGIFRTAVLDRLIPFSPCSGVELPKPSPRPVVPLQPRKAHDLADMINPRFRALILLAVGTGLRQGECFGLTVDRVDFLRHAVKVDRQLADDANGARVFAEPKTAKSVRTVPLPEIVGLALAAHIEAYPPGPNGLIFTAPEGGPLRRSRFHERWWAPARKAAGLPVETRFHDLRHTYASLLIEARESPKVIQERLGHSSITETMGVYGHLYPNSAETTRSAIDAALAPALVDEMLTPERQDTAL